MKHVLHIASWYPNRNGRQEGDFIQRQLRALALYQPVHVLAVFRDDKVIGPKLEVTKTDSEGLVEVVGYYNPANAWGLLPRPLVSLLTYRQHFKELITQYIQEHGKPDLVHVHVAYKAGLIALWIKRRFNIPFVISEHWSGYKRLDKEGIFFQPFPLQWFIRKTLNSANVIIPVSSSLAADIRLQTKNQNFTIVHNVVNEDLFAPTQQVSEDLFAPKQEVSDELFTLKPGDLNDELLTMKPDDVSDELLTMKPGDVNDGLFTLEPVDVNKVLSSAPFVFIHVSTMGHEKRPHLFLRAFDAFRKRYSASLICVGSVPGDLTDWIAANITHHADIRFTGNVPYQEVAALMRNAGCLLISSVYETFSCVAIEALLCGLPVISTPVGILPEVINADNGILAEDEEGFETAMIQVYQNRQCYNAAAISRAQKGRFSYQTIGNKLVELYAGL